MSQTITRYHPFGKDHYMPDGSLVENRNAFLLWLVKQGIRSRDKLISEFQKIGYDRKTALAGIQQCSLAGALRYDKAAKCCTYVRWWNGKQIVTVAGQFSPYPAAELA